MMVLVDRSGHHSKSDAVLSAPAGLDRNMATKVGCIGLQGAIIVLSPYTAGLGFIFRYFAPDRADTIQQDLRRHWNTAPLWQKAVLVAVSCVFYKIALLALGLIVGSARLGFAQAPSRAEQQAAQRAEEKYRSSSYCRV